MPRKRDAAYYRRHNEEMKLAMELGCTPKEASAIMDQVEAREKHRATLRRHGLTSELPPLRLPTNRAEFERWDAPWMMRS